jgi:hypothetical protein
MEGLGASLGEQIDIGLLKQLPLLYAEFTHQFGCFKNASLWRFAASEHNLEFEKVT